MSVIIKGMKIPGKCSDCRFVTWERGYVCLATSTPSALRETIKDKRRPDFCPLVPVPPHGRLIDEQWLKDAMITTLEALKKNPKMDKQEMHLIAAFYTLHVMVEDAPTIIPAEEGENG